MSDDELRLSGLGMGQSNYISDGDKGRIQASNFERIDGE